MKTDFYPETLKDRQEFKKNYVLKNLWYQRLSIFIAIIVYVGLGYFHARENPSLAKYIYSIRLGIVAPVAFLIIFCSFFKIYEKIAGFLFSVGIIAAGAGVIVLIKFCDDSAKYYFLTGLILIVFMNYTLKILLPWAFLSGIGIALVFNFSDYIFNVESSANVEAGLASADYMYVNMYLLAANVLGAYLAWVFEVYEKKDFLFKKNLEQEKFRIGSLNKSLQSSVQNKISALKEKDIQLKSFYEEKKSIEKELKNKSNEYLNLIANIEDACFEIDRTGSILLLNPGLSNLLETDYSQIRGKSLFDFLDSENTLKLKNEIWAFAQSADKTLTIGFNVMCRNEDRTVKHVEASVTKKFDSKGSHCGYLGIARDISKRRAVEKELEKTNRLKTFFLENINHELRTPLNGMTGFTHMLLSSRTLAEEDRKKALLIRESLEHMTFLINDLLDFSKVYEDEMVFENDRFFFSDLIERIIKQSKRYSFSSDFDIVFDKDNKISESYIGDLKRLANAVGSLIETSLRFWGPQNLELKAFAAGSDKDKDIVRLNVRPQKAHEIKDNFHFDADLNCISRSGFLFSVAGTMIEKMGGKVFAASDDENGFFVELKLEKDYPDDPAEENIGEQLISDKNILVVEDNKVNQMVLEAILKKEGANIFLASDGEKGIELLLNENIDIVLMDIQMPVMDGITAAQKIRAGEAGELKKNIPVIAVTAHAVTADRAKCIEAGMNDYLTKPVRPDVLRAALIKNLAG
ncbi:MAG: response regulator [Desulfobacteraceae bacterium]